MLKVTLEEFAARHKISERSLRKHITDGLIPPEAVSRENRKMMIDQELADKAMSCRIPRRVSLKATSGTPKKAAVRKANEKAGTSNIGYAEARLLKARYQAALLKLDIDQKTGKLVEAEKVKKAAFDQARMIRDSLLNIPERIGAILAAESDQGKITSLLSAEIRQALEGLSRD